MTAELRKVWKLWQSDLAHAAKEEQLRVQRELKKVVFVVVAQLNYESKSRVVL